MNSLEILIRDMRSNLPLRVCLFVVPAELLALASMILVGVWMSHYHDGFKWSHGDPRKFNFHPLFMTIGFIGLAPTGALIYRLLPCLPKFWVKIIHFVLHLSALSFALVGLTAVIQFHNEHDIDNFYSIHSWFGLITIFVFFLQLVGGFISFLFPRLPDDLRGRVVKWHAYFGVGILFLIFLTEITGVARKMGFRGFSSLKGEQILGNCLALVLLLLFGVLYFLFKTKPKRSDYERI